MWRSVIALSSSVEGDKDSLLSDQISLNLSTNGSASVVVMYNSTLLLCLSIMIIWEKKVPGGTPRRGVLGLDTTRGDRLFISLLSAAFIHLAWLGVVGVFLWAATIISLLFSIVVFRYF